MGIPQKSFLIITGGTIVTIVSVGSCPGVSSNAANKSQYVGKTHLLSLFVDALLPPEGGGVLVSDGGLVRQEHGRRAEHVAERVVQQVEHGGGVYVRIPRRRDTLGKLCTFHQTIP